MDSTHSGVAVDNSTMSTKLKSTNQGPDGRNTMDFQDGGPINQGNRGNFPNAEGNHINSDNNHFNQNMTNDSFGKMSENSSGPPNSNYNPGYNNRGNYMSDAQQHGSMNANSTGDMPGQFSQFGQQNMRPGFPQMMRNNTIPGRSSVPNNSMGMMPSNYGSPQRMGGGSSMQQQQQGGPTPTLNQLLTNSSTSQRYSGGYNNYDMSQSKGGHDMNNTGGYNSQNWSGQSQQGSNPYQQQMHGGQPFRNQGQMYDAQGRRGMGGGAAYPDNGQYGQYPSNNQRYPMQQGYPQQQQQQMTGGTQPQQQVPPVSTSQQVPGASQQSAAPQSQPGGGGSAPPAGTPNSQQPSPAPQQQNLSPQSNSSTKQANSQDGPVGTNSTGGPASEENNDVNARTTPTPTSQSNSSRPVPSPGGSAGSRSNTPASIPGNQAGSPMPPRPPSTHVEGRIQSPMATQGYSQQQMMPPPMHGGSTGQMGYPGKMGGHPNMMNNPSMGNQPYNNQYPNQVTNTTQTKSPMPPSYMPGKDSHIGRKECIDKKDGRSNFRGQPGMGGYSGQGGYNPQMGGGQMYPSNVPGQGGAMGMNRNMSNPNYPNSYPSGMANQYGNFNGPSGMGPNNMGSGGPVNMGPNAQSGLPQGAPGPMPNSMGSNIPSSGMSSNGPSITQGPHGPSQGSGGPTTNMPNAMNNMSPQNVPPNSNSVPGGQPPVGTTPKGAQAAAQAAMMAAASMASPTGRGMYMRQPGDAPAQQTSPNQQQQQQQKAPAHFAPGQSQMGFNQNQMGPDNMNNMGPGSGYNANMPNSMPNQDPMTGQMQGMGPNNIPPNAVAPGSGMGMAGQPGMNMSGQMNAMGPPSMPPPSMPSSSANSMQNMSSAVPSQADQLNAGMRPGMSVEGSPAPQNEERPATTSVGDSSTTVTQSITLPVTTSTENLNLDQRSATPSQHSESSNQSQPGEITTNGPSSLVPGGEDSNSQDALPHKVRLQKQDSNNVVPSPGANSMSSQHDEFENISSPSWPGTPKPLASESGKSEGATTSAAAMKQYDMGDELERRPFLDKLFAYLEDKGSPVTAMPMISKNPIDLYKLYTIVKDKGGLLEVTKGKKWREISTAINIGSSGSAGFTLRKNYIKYLFNYECTFDRGNMDPAPVLAQIELMSGKKDRKSSSSPAGGMMDAFRPPSNQGFDGYGGQQRMGMNDMGGGMGPGGMMHPNSNMMQNSPQMPYTGGMMPNNSMPPNTSVMPPTNSMMPNSSMPNQQGNMPSNMNAMGVPNSSQNSMMPNRPVSMPPSSGGDNITVQDPFADNVQMNSSSQFQRSQLPPYNSGSMPQQQQQQQPNMPPNSAGFYNRAQSNMGGTMGFNSGNQQSGMGGNQQQQGPYNNMGSGGMPGNDSYRRGMGPQGAGQQPPNQQQQPAPSGTPPEGFNNQFNNRPPAAGSAGPNNSQFPFGASAERFGQSSPAPPNQPSPSPSTHSQADSSQSGAQPLPRPPSAASHTSSTASPAPPATASDSGTSSPMPPSVPPQHPPQQPTPTPSDSGESAQPQPSAPPQQQPPTSQTNQMNNQMPPTSQMNVPMSQAPPMPVKSSSPMPPNSQMPPNDQMPPASQTNPSVSSMPNSQMSMMPNSQMSSMGNQMQPNQQMPGNQMANQMSYNRYGNQGGQYQQGGMGPQGAVAQGGMGQQGMNQGYNQQRGYPQTSMGGQMSGNMQGYGQQQSMGGYPGQKGMPQQYPQKYPGYGGRDGYNMSSGKGYQQSGYGQQSQYGYNQNRMGQDGQADPMRSTSNTGQTSPWTSAMHQRFSANGPYAQNQQQMPPSSGMSGHYGGMYNRMQQQRMSPQRPQDKGYYGTPHKQKSIAGSFQSKKDIVFPPDSVEATPPILHKRKRLNYKDVCPVDPWKVLMALKSGLMAESSWALDTLTILLFDDHTVPWFSLLHLPGLQEVLLDHFRQTLVQMFPGHFEDLEVQTVRQKRSTAKRFKKEHKQEEAPSPDVSVEITSPTGMESLSVEVDSDDENNGWDPDVFVSPSKEALNSPGNYTMKTRKGSTVVFDEQDRDEEYVCDKKKWDKYSGFTSDTKHWQDGKGDLSCHVHTQFHKDNTLEFFRKAFFGKENYKHIKPNNNILSSIKSESKKDDLVETEEEAEEAQCDETVSHSVKCESLSDPDPVVESDNSNEQKEINETTTDTVSSLIKSETRESDSPQAPSIWSHEEPAENGDAEKSEASTAAGDVNTNSASCPSPPVLSSEVEIKKEPVDEATSVASEAKEEKAKSEDEPEEKAKSEDEPKTDTDTVKNENESEVKTEGTNTDVEMKEAKPTVGRVKQEIKEEQLDPEALKVIAVEEMKIMESIKRKWEESEEESEAHQRDLSSLSFVTDRQDELAKRCVCISNIFRSLSFVPGNDREMSSHHGLMLTLGRLLLLHHRHPKRKREQRKFDREEPDVPIEDTIEDGRDEWWWDALFSLRENALVILANITGKMKLIDYPEEVSMTLLEGLIHWAVCPSSQAQDPLPSMAAHSILSPRRLVLEAMCKLSIKERNVDLMLATAPFTRIVQLLSILVDMLANRKEQVMREFSIVLLSALVAGDCSAARAVALLPPTISLLIDFLETAEQQAMTVANSHGVSMLRDNPEMMGTSLDMLRRAASMLLHMAQVPENRTLFLHQQQRLLQLVMSHILDSQISGIIADILFHCSDQINDDPAS